MNVLVLGGTSFVGRHLVLSSRAAGAEVTLFNRGRTNPDLFADLERVVGDRDGGLDALDGRRWDLIVDVNGYVPRLVADAVKALGDRCGTYVFVSTISVYGDVGDRAPDETTPVATLDDAETEEVTGQTYGPLKARCEDIVRDALGDRALVVRPGIVVGPHDPTERFVRWVRRGADDGAFLAPADPSGPVQMIDGRDLADWVVRMALAGRGGTFNATGPVPAATFGELLDTCVAVGGRGARPEWVDAAFLDEHGVRPWADLPLWLPAGSDGILRVDVSRAVAAGLTFRSLEDTVRATLGWDAGRADRGPAGLSSDREREILAAWGGR